VSAPAPLPAVNVLGTRVNTLNLPAAMALLEQWVQGGSWGRYVCFATANGLTAGVRDEAVRAAFNGADACMPDGMPLVWIGRLRGHASTDRVYGPDLMLATLAVSAQKGYTNYFYGGADTVASELQARMQQRFPALRVVGTYTPPFRALTDVEMTEVVDRISAASPDFLWIGLGSPKQEQFMAAARVRVRARVMLGVGAAFDFHSGRVRQAPRWMQRGGMEWLFRLCMDPRRLGRRYLLGNPLFLMHLACQALGLRKYPDEGTTCKPG